MVVGFIAIYEISAITTNVVNSNSAHDKMYLKQHYVMEFVIDLQLVGGFPWKLRIPPPMKLTAMI